MIRDYFIYCAFFKSLFRVRLQIFDNVDKQTVVSYFLVVGQAPALLTVQHTNMKSKVISQSLLLTSFLLTQKDYNVHDSMARIPSLDTK